MPEPTINDQDIDAYVAGARTAIDAGQHDPRELIRAGLAAAAPHIAAASPVSLEAVAHVIATEHRRRARARIEDSPEGHAAGFAAVLAEHFVITARPGSSVPARTTGEHPVGHNHNRCPICGLPNARHHALQRRHWPDLTDTEQDAVVAHERAAGVPTSRRPS